jgi:thiol-disulfide isomerase/thioredoxin
MVGRRQQPGQQATTTVLYQSGRVAAQGTVDIDGRRTLVRYTGVNLRTGVIDPNADRLEVDCDGDGTIDTDWTSPENSSAGGRPVVFRVGSHYVSTVSVDTASRTIVMRAHPAADYERIELSPGVQVPDFAYVDFDGKTHRLSEFRGKHLLLDFWGSWCGPCISSFPDLEDTYAKYHARGFEILGMDKENWDGDLSGPAIEKARAVITGKGLAWPQTRPDSVKGIITRFHIVPYPTYILLDPQGKVVSWGGKGQLPLDGPALATTLEKLLPKQR